MVMIIPAPNDQTFLSQSSVEKVLLVSLGWSQHFPSTCKHKKKMQHALGVLKTKNNIYFQTPWKFKNSREQLISFLLRLNHIMKILFLIRVFKMIYKLLVCCFFLYQPMCCKHEIGLFMYQFSPSLLLANQSIQNYLSINNSFVQ